MSLLAALVAALIAGHPVSIHCDLPNNPSLVQGWAYYGGSEIHMQAWACDSLSQPETPGFGAALALLIHESSHARGVRRESCADEWVMQLVGPVVSAFWPSNYEQTTVSEATAWIYALPEWGYWPQPCVAGDPDPSVVLAALETSPVVRIVRPRQNLPE